MATASRNLTLTDFEVQLLLNIQEKSNTFFDTVAFTIHRIVRDDIVIFSAPTAYFLVADPHFGLSLLVTLCLTELTNGIIKLYSIRPRPLWVSTRLQRKGPVWERDSSFPSSHAQTVATLFSFLLFEGKEHLPYTVWLYTCLVTGTFTLLTGFTRAYLALHFVSDVVTGWFLGFLVAFTVTRLDTVGAFARIPVPWAIFLSLFSTNYILCCLFLAAHIGKTGTDEKTLDKWLEIASQNTKRALGSSGEKGELVEGQAAERITPHEVVPYMMPAGSFLSSTLFPALLSLKHPNHPRSPRHSPLTLYRPYTTTSTEPSLSFWVVGVVGILVLDVLKSVVACRKKRDLWPMWKQAAFSSAFYAISVAWVLVGSGLVYGASVMELFRGYEGDSD